MRTISTEIHVAAPPQVVWDVLTDLPAHASWNPFIREAAGDPVEGGRLALQIAPPGKRPMRFRPVVTVLDPGQRLEWLGSVGVRGLFDGRHRFDLVAEPDGTTTLRHGEEFTGVLVPLFWRSMAGPSTEGFHAMNAALAARAAAVTDGA